MSRIADLVTRTAGLLPVLAARGAQAAGELYRSGVAASQEQRRQLALRGRSDTLGIPPEWYESIAREFGEEPLIATAMEKSAERDEARRPWSNVWQGLTEDPFEPVASWGGWRERPTMLSYELMELLSRRLGPFAGYMQTRLNQMSVFSQKQEEHHGLGLVVQKKGATKGEKKKDKRAEELTKIIMASGTTDQYDEQAGVRREGFRTVLRKLLRDTLLFDQINIEKRRDAKGRLVEWRTLDPKTIRRVSPWYEGKNWFGEPIRYVQVMSGTVAADFSHKDLTFFVRNPRSDIRAYGYGFSELEMAVSTITALLNGFDHNSRYFQQGTTAKGLLAIHGLVPPNKLRIFKQLWYNMVTGAGNAWRTPVLNLYDPASKVEWVDLQKSNLDMEWSRFMEWCLKVLCSVLQIAPEEIGFQMGNQGQKTTMNEGNQGEKIDASKDRGLPPLIDAVEVLLNEEIMEELDPEYEIKLAGLDQRTEQAEVELLVKEAGSYKTVDEVRAARDLSPLENDDGKVILNPTWLQYHQQAQQQQMMQQQQGAGGQPPDMSGFMGQEEQPGQPPEQGGYGDLLQPGLKKARIIRERFLVDV